MSSNPKPQNPFMRKSLENRPQRVLGRAASKTSQRNIIIMHVGVRTAPTDASSGRKIVLNISNKPQVSRLVSQCKLGIQKAQRPQPITHQEMPNPSSDKVSQNHNAIISSAHTRIGAAAVVQAKMQTHRYLNMQTAPPCCHIPKHIIRNIEPLTTVSRIMAE